jgi:hypothetical protein
MTTSNSARTLIRYFSLLVAATMGSGCAEYNSRAARVDAHFGEAVNEMRMAQTFNPDKRLHPDPDPIMRRDGMTSHQILNSNYRRNIWHPPSQDSGNQQQRSLIESGK